MKKMLSTFIVCLLCLSLFLVVLPQVVAGPVPEIKVTTVTDKTNARVGDVVAYSFIVTNIGRVTLFDVTVDNTLVGPGDYLSESGRTNLKLESGESWIFTASYTVGEGDPDPLVNTATATANTRKGQVYSAIDVHNVYIYGGVDDVLPDVLTSPNQEPSGGWYGCSVAVGEGLIVVGAAYESIPNPLYDATLRKQTEPSQIYAAGRAYVYSASTGELLSTLTSPNPSSPGFFGYSVAVGEGVIVVGAPKETSGEVTLAGNAYVFDAVRYESLYNLTTTDPVSDNNGYCYGTSVAVNDGIIAVGSAWEVVNSITGAGRVYLYYVEDGTALSFSPLVTPDPQEHGRFGIAVAVGDGIIVVGAAYQDITVDSDLIEGAGRVYIYNSASGAQTDTEVSPNPEPAGHFGFSVAIDAGLVVVGAFDEAFSGLEEAGSAYVYTLATTPKTISYYDSLNSGTPEYRGLFGNSVAVGEGLIVVGAEIETSGTYARAGNAYVYNTAGDLLDTLTSLDPEYEETFGWSVALGEGVIAVGAYDAVYIFE